ncbi:MAG TPA: M23 family metallopeptidase [Candidatus Limnocylindria bacterium]|nr:M23 family metallopeptidase [Candidatus Limnocylindria bacterium]
MKPPFQLLLVHGDGTQVARLRLSRWLAYGTVFLAAVSAGTVVGLSSEWLRLERGRGEVAALRRRVQAQDELIAAFEERVAAIRRDVTTWRAFHEDMWAALGPENANAETVGAEDAESGDASVEEPSPFAGVGGPRPRIMRINPTANVQPLEQLDRLAGTMAAEEQRLRELTDLVGQLGTLVKTLPLRWPVQGPVNSKFGRRRSPWGGRIEHHGGIDIGAPMGVPVESPAPGKVIVAATGGGLGKHVKLDHGNGVRSVYGHLSRIDVKPGARVAKGEVIGLVGSTGRSTGPHLHYEVRVDGKRVDPRAFLRER